MNQSLRFKTNLNCQTCVAAVKPHLDAEPSIDHWEVDTAVADKILTVHGKAPSSDQVRSAVAKAGFKVLGELPANRPEPVSAPTTVLPAGPVTYFPLLLLVGFLTGTVALVEFASGGPVWERAMRNFMGGFFLTFSFFKLLDLPGFAATYQMYDVVARRFPVWGKLYPFIELLLGMAYVSGFQPFWTNLVTLLVMSVSAVGVIQSLWSRKKIRCACLGTVFNLPMSTVTLVEDGLMIAMALVMLVAGHPTDAPEPVAPIHTHLQGDSPMLQSTHDSGHGAHDQDHAGADQNTQLMVESRSIRPAGEPSDLRLMIHGADGATATSFETNHEEKVHLIIVREGLDTFAHVHPAVAADGSLSTTYTFPAGGRYRLFADYQMTGQSQAVATAMIEVPGKRPVSPALVADVPGLVKGDGLDAEVDINRSAADAGAMINFDLRDPVSASPVDDLQPYLGAKGHLVIISEDGAEYVHAHPVDPVSSDPVGQVSFHAGFKSRGLFKGWGQFKRAGAVHVVPFVIDIR